MRSRDGFLLPQFLFLWFLGSALSTTGKVDEVRLGGLFPLSRLTGQQRLAGFLLAVKEINEANTILPNIPIKIVVKDSFDVGKTFFATLDMATNSFQKRGIDACVGASSSAESEAAATVFSRFSKTQISYASTVSLLSTKINAPYFARTCPSDTFQGDAMANLVANYGW
jgi:ABC-type branched-subunit amino acid transport system substrate-binding protein